MADFTCVPRTTTNHDHTLTVRATWPHAGTDRTEGLGINCGMNRSLATRLAAAMTAGVVFARHTIKTDIEGNTFVSAERVVMGRTLNADLKRLGY